jgi:hypothetical protein
LFGWVRLLCVRVRVGPSKPLPDARQPLTPIPLLPLVFPANVCVVHEVKQFVDGLGHVRGKVGSGNQLVKVGSRTSTVPEALFK